MILLTGMGMHSEIQKALLPAQNPCFQYIYPLNHQSQSNLVTHKFRHHLYGKIFAHFVFSLGLIMYFLKAAAAAMMLVSFSASADVALTKEDVVGVWQIDKESMHADGKDARTGINTTWEFKTDGTMVGISDDKSDAHARVNQLRAVLNYSVENGKLLKQAAAGRSKMDACVAIEKNGSNMVLKCSPVYFFMTKK